MDYFDKNVTCAVTGHRVLKNDFDDYKLIETLQNLIERGYTTFLIGMAKGFDMKCFEALLSLENKNVEIIACVPCKNQSAGYSKKDKERYTALIQQATKVIKLGDEYFNGCMQIRNRFMVDNASVLLAYMYAERGGTLYTVNYAKKKEKEIIFI